MKRTVLGLIAVAVLTPRLNAQTACAVRVDLRWIDTLPGVIAKPVQPPNGVTLAPQQAQIAADFLGKRVGPIYWQEVSRKGYPDICLDAEHADYFVFWNGVGGSTNTFVFPRREPLGCAISKVVFTTAKSNKDSERSAKEAFKETLAFLRTSGKGDYLSIRDCIPPEKIEHLGESIAAQEESQTDGDVRTPPNRVSASSDPSRTFLDISSTPSGADIELDGSFIGNTPSSVSVPVGEHALRITKSKYRPWERKISALAGKISVAAELEAEQKPAPQPQR